MNTQDTIFLMSLLMILVVFLAGVSAGLALGRDDRE